MDKKILVVDDAMFMRSIIRKILKEAGYTQVWEAQDGTGRGKGHGAVSGGQPGPGTSGYHHAGTFRSGGAGGDAGAGSQCQGHYVLCGRAGDDDTESPDHRGLGLYRKTI